MKWAAIAVLFLLIVLGGVTLVALEGAEVVVLHSHDGAGLEHATRTWVADLDGDAWIEAANDARPFLRDVRSDPHVTLDRYGWQRTCAARVVPNPEGHDTIRRLLAEKYGWADGWIGLLTDTSGSSAVRLACP